MKIFLIMDYKGGTPHCKKISPPLVKIFGYIFPHRFADELYMVGIMCYPSIGTAGI